MAGGLSPWRALRPVLLAGAATLTWLTLSSAPASADGLTDTTSLVDGVTSSVATVTDTVAAPLPAAPVPAPAPAPPPAPADVPGGLLQPVASSLAEPADAVVAAVPVVSQVLPTGTVTEVSAPVAGVVDQALAEAVEVVVPPLAESVPVLQPVLAAVSDVVTGAGATAVPLPDVTDPLLGQAIPGVVALSPNATTVELSEAPALSEADVTVSLALPDLSSPVAGAIPPVDNERLFPSSGQPGQTAPGPFPVHSPAIPGSVTGSGMTSAGSPGSAAWMDPYNFQLLSPGALGAGEIPEHAPPPVSFDPGSSPD